MTTGEDDGGVIRDGVTASVKVAPLKLEMRFPPIRVFATQSSGFLFHRMIHSAMARLPPPTPGKHNPDLEASVLSIVISSVCWVEASGNEMFALAPTVQRSRT